MKINEIEKLTNVSKQNIRFYESKGLLSVNRDNNSYRNYDEEDVIKLKRIVVLRKLGFSIEEITELFNDNNIDIEKHIEKLKIKVDDLSAMIKVCNILKEDNLEAFNPDTYLKYINEEEKDDKKFNSFKEDFKLFNERKYQEEFTFIPDTMCVTKEEFTYELVKYAERMNLDLEIVSESLSPVFRINGILYNATRYTSRFGAYVICVSLEKDKLPKLKFSKKRKIQIYLLYYVLPITLISTLTFISIFFSMPGGPLWLKLLLSISIITLILPFMVTYNRHLQDK